MWADLVAWFESPGGVRVLQTAVVPALAILVAGVLAALIGRSAVRAVVARSDREGAAAAVAALVEAARTAAERDGAKDGRRRVARLRTEADVRTRLLPLKGSAAAADWASDRIDALQEGRIEGPAAVAVDDLRDRLIAWTRTPGRAKRLFATGAGPTARRAAAERTARPDSEQPAGVEALVAPEHEGVAQVVAPVASTSPAQPEPPAADEAPSDAPSVPAWRRTRSAERLHEQQRAAREQTDDEPPIDTAPVRLQQAHRAQGAPSTDADEAVREEARRLVKSARTDDAAAGGDRPEPVPAPRPAAVVAPASAPASTPAPAPAVAAEASGDSSKEAAEARRRERVARAKAARDRSAGSPDREAPAWLDTYDDEAQVTANLDLRTPPPVAATAVRDRSPSGEDIVPRT